MNTRIRFPVFVAENSIPGQRHDIKGVKELITGVDSDALPADKTFDAKLVDSNVTAARLSRGDLSDESTQKSSRH